MAVGEMTIAAPKISQDQALAWYRKMRRIRAFEDGCLKPYKQERKIRGFCHLYSGQESLAVGSIGALRDDDYIITAYRDHGHALARGMNPRSLMAEMFGKRTGCVKGKGGSMHFFDAGRNFLGGHAIVAGHIPLAAGVGFKIKYMNEDRVCVCYFGDGAVNQGSMHEAMNMASLWKLPVIFVLENNLYAMGTEIERSSAVTDFTVRCGKAYGIVSKKVEAKHIEEMAEAMAWAADRARAGKGPVFLEAVTYRYQGHSMADPQVTYRIKELHERALLEDPIVLYAAVLKERGWLSDEEDERIAEEARAEVEDAIEFAEASPEPALEELYEDITVAAYQPQESE